MNNLLEIPIYIIEVLGGLYIGIVLLRFLLQMARADFYNELSQAVVKLTNPLLIPLRRVIRSIGGLDMASIVLALLLQIVIAEIIILIAYQTLVNPLPLLIYAALGCINMIVYIFYGCGLIMVVSSFVAPFSSNPIIVLARQILSPFLGPIQRLIPPLGGLDFSILFFFLGLGVFQKLLWIVVTSIPSGITPAVVIGF